MQAPSGQMTAPPVQALLTGGALAGEWLLDPRKSSIRLKTKIMGLVPVKGVFREVSGNGTVSADGKVSGTVPVAAASIDSSNLASAVDVAR
jgi:polyisoprenoid-binding protein YceI